MFEDVELNSNSVNANIKAHILSDDKMREIGFTDRREGYWYYCKGIGNGISFNVTIPKDGIEDISIDVLDEDYCQPFDYQRILSKDPDDYLSNEVKIIVDTYMEELIDSFGVLSNWKRGDYI